MLTISFNPKYVNTNKRAGVKEERRKSFLSSVNEACHCVWPLSALICLINMHANVPILWLNSSDSL